MTGRQVSGMETRRLCGHRFMTGSCSARGTTHRPTTPALAASPTPTHPPFVGSAPTAAGEAAHYPTVPRGLLNNFYGFPHCLCMAAAHVARRAMERAAVGIDFQMG